MATNRYIREKYYIMYKKFLNECYFQKLVQMLEINVIFLNFVRMKSRQRKIIIPNYYPLLLSLLKSIKPRVTSRSSIILCIMYVYIYIYISNQRCKIVTNMDIMLPGNSIA